MNISTELRKDLPSHQEMQRCIHKENAVQNLLPQLFEVPYTSLDPLPLPMDLAPHNMYYYYNQHLVTCWTPFSNRRGIDTSAVSPVQGGATY